MPRFLHPFNVLDKAKADQLGMKWNYPICEAIFNLAFQFQNGDTVSLENIGRFEL